MTEQQKQTNQEEIASILGKQQHPKREQVSMWTNKALQSISTQKAQMHGVIGTLVCFEKIFSISQQTLHNAWH